MTPEQLHLVGLTLAEVHAEPDAFAADFYDRLFALAPDTRQLFPAPGGPGPGLVEAIAFLAGAVRDLPAFVDRARDLGARHHRYGVRTDHYELMEQALLAAFAGFLGERWNRTTMLAWQGLIRLMVETMLEGAARGAFVDPA